MKKKQILTILCSFLLAGLSAQTLEEARELFAKGEYEKAKPVFRIQLKAQPGNGNYNYWYGVCCLKTGQPEEAVPHLETAVKKRVTGGQLHLGQAYDATYRYEDAVACFEKYVTDLKRLKRPAEEGERLLERSKARLRMLKGVEKVCVIDSFTVDKERFLEAYKISGESGKLHTYNAFFGTEGKHPGTVYETEIGNRIYYGDGSGQGTLSVFSRSRLGNEWGAARPLPENINGKGNTGYPFVMTDGATVYYATDGEGLGGYDIYVTRYNTNTDTYLTPENVGMPFNSPYNDYMYVIDEYNNLGWFASDRFQPVGKVCVYVFIPNTSKQTYDYESAEPGHIVRMAKLHSLKETWEDEEAVAAAKKRLEAALNYRPKQRRAMDFEFVIDDRRTYYLLSDFRSEEAREMFRQYQQLEKDCRLQREKLDAQREEYAQAGESERAVMAPAIRDLEERVLQMALEMDSMRRGIRNAEINDTK